MIRVQFYDSDHGGMRDELTETRYFPHSYTPEQIQEIIETTRSPWGFNYKISDDNQPRHGAATITIVPERAIEIEKQVAALRAEYKELMYGEEL